MQDVRYDENVKKKKKEEERQSDTHDEKTRREKKKKQKKEAISCLCSVRTMDVAYWVGVS